jgi:hypothetical protein
MGEIHMSKKNPAQYGVGELGELVLGKRLKDNHTDYLSDSAITVAPELISISSEVIRA